VAEAGGLEILHFEHRPVTVSFYVARLRQKPHPPFWMAAGTPSSIRRVAERAACGRAYNPMGIALARDMHVAAYRQLPDGVRTTLVNPAPSIAANFVETSTQRTFAAK
jgi:alkanesulfonate monooxygenase SsuD/methylene tetrahydromethanopterin reductase-like flavin-dependent oxidoreductase (luciferase family)